ncbi:MAG: hypothetical protein KIT14_22565 [bacterium]|nr:hypothetical protein [bacterium]
MTEITFHQLASAIAGQPEFRPPAATGASTRQLVIAQEPKPYIPPTLYLEGSEGDLNAEVLFIQAPAAVGKTALARYLSATLSLPLLNLAKVPVSTGSLQALVANLSGAGSPIDAFHEGRLPVIVDALDEGRLLSGETGFESFLSTAGEFLLSDRRVVNRPKLIFLGRSESTDIAQIGLLLEGHLSSCLVDVAFFKEAAARELIDRYARAAATASAPYHVHPAPVADVITAYFSAIEAALGLRPGDLWSVERGQAFAGYAPVLAAVGSLMAAMENFSQVATRLRESGTQEAWGVIEKVLDEILDRERKKLTDQLAPQVSVALPAEAYDDLEQLSFLTQYVHGQRPRPTGRVTLPSADSLKYDMMVKQYIQEHPFVHHGEFRDPVLGAVVLAFAVSGDLIPSGERRKLVEASRQPFLWRSLHRPLATGTQLIDGSYLGAILSSFWSDPLTKKQTVTIRSPDEGAVEVTIPSYSNSEIVFAATAPITLENQVRDCDVDILGAVRLQGHAPQGSGPTFHVLGNTTILCEHLEIAADTLTLHGNVWFEPGSVTATDRLEVRLKNGTRVGWGAALAKQYPWNQIPTALSPPYGVPDGDPLFALLKECRQRLRGGFTLMSDYSTSEDDPHTRWADRAYPSEFPKLMRALVDNGLAAADMMSASGASSKVHVHLAIGWQELEARLRNPTAEDQALAKRLREAIS